MSPQTKKAKESRASLSPRTGLPGGWLAIPTILVAISSLAWVYLAKIANYKTVRCGGEVTVPYCYPCEDNCCFWCNPFQCVVVACPFAGFLPTLGADGKPFLIDVGPDVPQEKVNWAGEATVAMKATKTRFVPPEIETPTHSQAICYWYGDGSIFDITYECMIIRW